MKNPKKQDKNNKCRVLFVVQYLGLSGAEICALRLLENLDNKRFEAKILHYYPAKPEAMSKFASIRERFLFVDRKSSHLFICWMRNMINTIRRFRPDVIVCFGSTCFFYGRLFGMISGVKTFITVKGDTRIPGGILKWSEILFCGCKQLHIAVSNAVCEVIKSYLRVYEPQVRTVYNGISLREFQPGDTNKKLRVELGISENTQIVTSVATLNRFKNHPLLMRAARLVLKQNSNCVFLVVGQDLCDYNKCNPGGESISNESYLRGLARELNIESHIVFTGPRVDVADILSITDVFVMPSWQEGLNVATIEAMAMEIPVVATSVGGLREVVDDCKTGYQVESDNEEEMADRIIKLLKNSTLRTEFGKAGRKRVQELFTIEPMVNNYQDLIAEICNGTDSGGKVII